MRLDGIKSPCFAVATKNRVGRRNCKVFYTVIAPVWTFIKGISQPHTVYFPQEFRFSFCRIDHAFYGTVFHESFIGCAVGTSHFCIFISMQIYLGNIVGTFVSIVISPIINAVSIFIRELLFAIIVETCNKPQSVKFVIAFPVFCY